MNLGYGAGDAAAYWGWLEHQTGEVHALAARFRPWEIYKLQGRDIFVQVIGYEAKDGVELLQVQYLDPKYKGGIIPVVPHQIDLWGVRGWDDPAEEAA